MTPDNAVGAIRPQAHAPAPRPQATVHATAPAPARAVTHAPAHAAAHASAHAPQPSKILRFLPGERFLHWALAGPFVLLYLTGGLMFLFYGEPSPRHIRPFFALAHRIVGVLLIVLPPMALLRFLSDRKIHFENMREGWIWRKDDIRWLMLFPKNAVNPKIELPDQGKFNAAEKLNFMMVSTFYPLYIITGIMVWMPGVAVVAYLTHYAMAVAGLPLVCGHIFMATINPSTRIGLSGMFTGWVDRHWAKHHYTRWYREHFEPREVVRGLAERLKHPARVRCGSCEQVQSFPSWSHLIEHSFQVEPLVCPSCESPIRLVKRGEESRAPEIIMQHLQTVGEKVPIEDLGAGVA
jgi:formate dehydrogenase subunit gamma